MCGVVSLKLGLERAVVFVVEVTLDEAVDERIVRVRINSSNKVSVVLIKTVCFGEIALKHRVEELAVVGPIVVCLHDLLNLPDRQQKVVEVVLPGPVDAHRVTTFGWRHWDIVLCHGPQLCYLNEIGEKWGQSVDLLRDEGKVLNVDKELGLNFVSR